MMTAEKDIYHTVHLLLLSQYGVIGRVVITRKGVKAMFEKGWFVPVERDGRILYVKAEEGDENAVEGEFVVAEVVVPLLKNPKKLTTEEQKLQEMEIEKRTIKYYVPATEKVKNEIKRKCAEVGAAFARIELQRVKEYAKKGLNYWEERQKQLEMDPEARKLAESQKELEQKAAAMRAASQADFDAF